ncbi:unnamed protein product [Toxocara canis]|uniref:Ovule protein n=1 Tax=Toxocara canis TaxID=6265 RepID=A0A183UJG1_TOXCA|nr:unnamed protein product [Toxocara canis]
MFRFGRGHTKKSSVTLSVVSLKCNCGYLSSYRTFWAKLCNDIVASRTGNESMIETDPAHALDHINPTTSSSVLRPKMGDLVPKKIEGQIY